VDDIALKVNEIDVPSASLGSEQGKAGPGSVPIQGAQANAGTF
jgi:hypothetical protein